MGSNQLLTVATRYRYGGAVSLSERYIRVDKFMLFFKGKTL